MTANQVERIFLHHLVNTGNPVPDGATGGATQRVGIRSGLVKVVSGKHDSLFGKPDIELVSGFSCCGNKFKLNS